MAPSNNDVILWKKELTPSNSDLIPWKNEVTPSNNDAIAWKIVVTPSKNEVMTWKNGVAPFEIDSELTSRYGFWSQNDKSEWKSEQYQEIWQNHHFHRIGGDWKSM